jgi:hypothetical protein
MKYCGEVRCVAEVTRRVKGRREWYEGNITVNVALYLYYPGRGIVCTTLAGDASTRRETRLTCDEGGSDRSEPRPEVTKNMA